MDVQDCATFDELHAAAPGSVGGWQTVAERQKLVEIARAMQPGQRFMEIGVFGGTTLSIFGLLAPPTCEIIGMDSWENGTPNADPVSGEFVDLRTFCVRNLERNGVEARVRLIDGSSHVHGQTWTLSLDVLLIDGDHTYAGAKQDLRDFARWVTVGGLLCMDDYWSGPAVKGATDDWLAGELADQWYLEWGGTYALDANENQVSKMVIYRRRT